MKISMEIWFLGIVKRFYKRFLNLHSPETQYIFSWAILFGFVNFLPSLSGHQGDKDYLKFIFKELLKDVR